MYVLCAYAFDRTGDCYRYICNGTELNQWVSEYAEPGIESWFESWDNRWQLRWKMEVNRNNCLCYPRYVLTVMCGIPNHISPGGAEFQKWVVRTLTELYQGRWFCYRKHCCQFGVDYTGIQKISGGQSWTTSNNNGFKIIIKARI